MKTLTVAHHVRNMGTIFNVYHANKDEGLPRHEHEFPHLTMCHSGSCVVRQENREFVMTKETPAHTFFEKEWHEVVALEDNTVIVNIFSDQG